MSAMITLRPITAKNWNECIGLQPGEDQKRFVASNLYSLAESKFKPWMVPLGIYDGEEMIGFVMYGLDQDDGNPWIYRLMVSEGRQGKGCGRAALREVIARLRAIPGRGEIKLSFNPGNARAEKLYESIGFRRTGEVISGEVVACLKP